MTDIVIVKNKDLLRMQFESVLQQSLPEYNVMSYPSEQVNEIYMKKPLPLLVIIDLSSIHDAKDLIDHCKRNHIKVAVWTSRLNEKLSQLFELGLDGYFIHEIESDELAFAVHEILQDRPYVHGQLTSVLLQDYLKAIKGNERPKDLLTDREWEVLHFIIKGYQTSDIAKRLSVAPKTVTNHVTSILSKLNVPDRTNAVLLALQKRWFVL